VEEKTPSWVQKITRRLKQTFCLQVDIHKRQYEQHCNEKKSRQREKSIMRALSLEVSPPGTEMTITPEDQSMSAHATALPANVDEIQSPPRTPVYPGASSYDGGGGSAGGGIPPGWENATPWGV
jgi:hypothetical protein